MRCNPRRGTNLGMGNEGIRAKRLAATIQKHLSGVFAREVQDPRLAALGIEEVTLSGDLSIVTVRVRLAYGEESAEERAQAMQALSALAPGLRSSLAPVLRVRRVPELRFVYDEGVEHRQRIEAVLAEIQREDEERRRQLQAGEESGEEPPSAEKR